MRGCLVGALRSVKTVWSLYSVVAVQCGQRRATVIFILGCIGSLYPSLPPFPCSVNVFLCLCSLVDVFLGLCSLSVCESKGWQTISHNAAR